MSRGSKEKYTRQAEAPRRAHIEDGLRGARRGIGARRRLRRAWATVNKETGGGEGSGSGRGKAENRSASRKGGRLGGLPSAARPASAKSASARKAAATRKAVPRASGRVLRRQAEAAGSRTWGE